MSMCSMIVRMIFWLKFGKQFMKMNCYRVLVDFRDFYDFEFIDGEF